MILDLNPGMAFLALAASTLPFASLATVLEDPPVEDPVVTEEALEEEGVIEPEAAEPAITAPVKTVVFTAKQLFLGDGRVLEEGMLIVKDGVIAQVGKGLAIPAGAALVEHGGAITPGMIALHAYDGAEDDLADSTRELLPEAEARFAFRPEHGDFERALHAGITAMVLTPTPENLIGGQAVAVKTSGGEVVKADTHLAIGLSSEALNENRFPTSYVGAMKVLDGAFSDPKGPVGRAASGNLPVLITVGDRAETLRGCAFASKYGLKGALYGSFWAEDVVSAIKDSGLSVICTPFDVGDDSRGVRSVIALAKAGVRFGFGLDTPERSPESLRFGAALCVRAGLDRIAARRALFADAAEIAGLAARLGRIGPGLDADLVFWTGDPIDLTSEIRAVYIDGERVFGGEK